MRVTDTPFQSGWLGQGLPGVRPGSNTYNIYPLDELPPPPSPLHADFEWLSRQPTREGHIGLDKPEENEAAMPVAIADAVQKGLELPAELIRFAQSPELQHRVRSCTDCFFDLSPGLVPFPLAGGHLLRFLADSQGCVYWYLFQRPGSADHCVVASHRMYMVASEHISPRPPDPAGVLYCAASFEAFIWRFWSENEISFCGYEKRSPSAEGQYYLDAYKRKR